MSFLIHSPSFDNGAEIPRKYTGDENDISPPLNWTVPPIGTKGLVLLCEDRDALGDEPWVHWILCNIPPTAVGLSEAFDSDDTPGVRNGVIRGINSWGNWDYGGPLPPKGHGWHRYFFRLFALDEAIPRRAEMDKRRTVKEMQGHILAQTECLGKYQR